MFFPYVQYASCLDTSTGICRVHTFKGINSIYQLRPSRTMKSTIVRAAENWWGSLDFWPELFRYATPYTCMRFHACRIADLTLWRRMIILAASIQPVVMWNIFIRHFIKYLVTTSELLGNHSEMFQFESLLHNIVLPVAKDSYSASMR